MLLVWTPVCKEKTAFWQKYFKNFIFRILHILSAAKRAEPEIKKKIPDKEGFRVNF